MPHLERLVAATERDQLVGTRRRLAGNAPARARPARAPPAAAASHGLATRPSASRSCAPAAASRAAPQLAPPAQRLRAAVRPDRQGRRRSAPPASSPPVTEPRPSRPARRSQQGARRGSGPGDARRRQQQVAAAHRLPPSSRSQAGHGVPGRRSPPGRGARWRSRALEFEPLLLAQEAALRLAERGRAPRADAPAGPGILPLLGHARAAALRARRAAPPAAPRARAVSPRPPRVRRDTQPGEARVGQLRLDAGQFGTQRARPCVGAGSPPRGLPRAPFRARDHLALATRRETVERREGGGAAARLGPRGLRRDRISSVRRSAAAWAPRRRRRFASSAASSRAACPRRSPS